MPNVEANLEFIADLPIYNKEKPFHILKPEDDDPNFDPYANTNLKFESHSVLISDLRGTQHTLATSGFQVVNHKSQFLELDTHAYKVETKDLLSSVFPDAAHILVWDFHIRKNLPQKRPMPDFNYNPVYRLQLPAQGAHDSTPKSVQNILDRHLTQEQKNLYLTSGYRAILIGTWRPLVDPILEDRPLALCDYQSTSQSDLIAADRFYGDRVGEVYYMRYDPGQRWHWLSEQTPEEVFVMKIYDSHPQKDESRYCPHVSFENPLAPEGAQIRESLETRSIVILKR
ncbi:hypothetical protein DFH27DRAFT_560449 [Peziza echinospora]|nr:hypothetical protein DFH27DRAFT_560449 [Peziza echinospora]